MHVRNVCVQMPAGSVEVSSISVQCSVRVHAIKQCILEHHAQHLRTSVSCLDERTACIYVFSSDVCAFS